MTPSPDPHIDVPSRLVHTGDHWVAFRSEDVFRLFLLLVTNRAHVVSRRSMIAHLWPDVDPRLHTALHAKLSQRISLLHGYLRGSPRWRIVTHYALGAQLADDWKLTETTHDAE